MATSDPTVLMTYETPQGRAAVKACAVAEYRCAGRGCLLLHVWQSPAGPLFYRPAYKLSRDVNERESSPEGRAANTADGENHWRADAGHLAGARGWPEHTMPLQCDHFRANVETAKILADADRATPGKPKRRRFPVSDW